MVLINDAYADTCCLIQGSEVILIDDLIRIQQVPRPRHATRMKHLSEGMLLNRVTAQCGKRIRRLFSNHSHTGKYALAA